MTPGFYYILDENKNIVTTQDQEEWIKFFGDPQRIVKQEQIGDFVISTVFLTMNHNFIGNGPPILFETMIFGGLKTEYQERCCTWEEAQGMHSRAVEYVKNFVASNIVGDNEIQTSGMEGCNHSE